MELPEISIEQNNIIKYLNLDNNVIVDSVAGSGKTTCILYIAKHFNNDKILILTYNSKLKLETREKVKKIGCNNIEVHSYHSFCVKYYDNECFTDTIINKIIKNENKSLKQFNYDLIILDETQDMTITYYELVCKIYKDNDDKNTKICIFGDKKQSIFDFNKADQRYIEYANEIFNFNSYKWIKCNLSISFRITYEMSLFINKCLLHKDWITSKKILNTKPRYIICDCFGDKYGSSSRTFEEVKYYLNLGYKPNDIFILAPSVKSGLSPVRLLENKIKRELPDVMVYVPVSDEEKLDEEVLKGKIIFSTFHQTKGLERKVVIIFNFDSSYFEYYKKNANPCICSNELYVATTRAIEHLTLFHDSRKEYFRFIDKRTISQYCYFEGKINDFQEKVINNKNYTSTTSITEMIKFLPENIIDKCFNELEIKKDNNYLKDKINIPLKIQNNETTENVSEITGIAIPNMFELKLKNKMSIFDELINNDFEEKVINNKNGFLILTHNKPKNKKYDINNINIENLTPEELLYISNCWNTFKNGFLFKIYQITDYEWLEEEKLNECMNRMSKLNISIHSLFEYNIEIDNEVELLNRKLVGYIDCIDEENNVVYEFKCVQKLEKDHYLQLALYMYMYELKKLKQITNKDKIIYHFLNDKERQDCSKLKIYKREIYETKEYETKENETKETKYVLFNILTNEYITIKCEMEKLKKIVETIIFTKYVNVKSITDEDFINKNKNIQMKYIILNEKNVKCVCVFTKTLYESCSCSSCENWGGCNNPISKQYYQCKLCNKEKIESQCEKLEFTYKN